MTIPDTLLDRFFDALVREIRVSRPAYLQAPFTVAEIYQNLVPYRTHRDVIGAEINGDYEDALLRLLAGEGEFLQLESEPARRRIQDELQGSNPNTTIYREFAAAEVRLHPGRARMLASEAAAGPPGGGGHGDAGGGVDAPGQAGTGSRVDVGWAPEEATPVSEGGPSDPGVNPDLGLFVSDLFGGGGEDQQEEGMVVESPAPVEDSGGAGAGGEEFPLRPAEMGTHVAESGARAPASPPPSVASSPGWEPATQPPPVSTPPTLVPQEVLSPPLPPPQAPPGEPRREGAPVSGLEDENRRLRRIVADQALEILRLKDLLDRS